MKTKTRKVYFYTINCSKNFDLEKVLMSNESKAGIDIDGKTLEIGFVEKDGDLITGAFVVTKKSGIAPIHTPGTNKYKKVGLEADQGLGYPNAFLFDLKNMILQFEFNRDGAFISRVEEFLTIVSSEFSEESESFIEFNDLLTKETYTKILNFDKIEKIYFKLANPSQLIADEVGLKGSLKDFSKIAKDANANHSLQVTMVGEKKGNGLDKKIVKNILEDMVKASRNTFTSKTKNSLQVTGVKASSLDNDLQTSDVIDLFLDKFKDSFDLQEPLLYEGIQYFERKREMLNIYRRRISQIGEIIKIK